MALAWFAGARLAKSLFAFSKRLEARGVKPSTAFVLPVFGVMVLIGALTITTEFAILRSLVGLPK